MSQPCHTLPHSLKGQAGPQGKATAGLGPEQGPGPQGKAATGQEPGPEPGPGPGPARAVDPRARDDPRRHGRPLAGSVFGNATVVLLSKYKNTIEIVYLGGVHHERK